MQELINSLTDFSWIGSSEAWIGLVTLVALEVVLGIDNIVFISILSSKLPPERQDAARKQGLLLAVIPRLLFLLMIGVILKMQAPLFTLPFEDPAAGHGDVAPGTKLGITGQNLVLIVGGLFLLVQAVREIHHKLEGDADQLSETGHPGGAHGTVTMKSVLISIMLMNIVFSLDSIVTAIGMTKLIPIMMLSVIISTVVMMIAVNPVSRFVEKHPTVKMLALSFLLLIGTTLLIEALHFHIPKGYVYFAMGFSVLVELLNIKASRGKGDPVHLHPPA